MKIITREMARLRGLKTYYTGKPCVHGHDAERRVDGGQCVICQRESSKKWNNANKERVLENVMRWNSENEEYVRKYRYESYYQNHEKCKERARDYARKKRNNA